MTPICFSIEIREVALPELSAHHVPLDRLRILNTAGIRYKQPYERLDTEEPALGNDLAPLASGQPQIHQKKLVRAHSKTWKQTWSDIREVQWSWLGRRAATHFLPPLFAAGLIVLLVLMSARRGLFTYISIDACTADGEFLLNDTDSSRWITESVFAIDIRLGSSTFAVAKLIDICWDVISRNPTCR